ncbi:MAG: hypothetical protein Q9223_004779, partial [Gallowayella weberi]
MAPSHDEDSYSFGRLKGPENYEQWSNNMRGALLAADLFAYIDNPNSRPPPPQLVSRADDNEDRKEKIFERAERIAKYQGRVNICLGKIYRQCAFNVQQILDADEKHPGGVTASAASWTPKQLWNTIKTMCTEKGWGIKWGLINRLGDTYLRADSEAEANSLLSRCLDLSQKIKSHDMNMNELLAIMVLNQLPQQFDTLKKIKRNAAKNASKVPTIQEIVEDIKDDMRNRHQSSQIVNYVGQPKGKGKPKGKGDKDRPKCTSCDKTGHEEKNCFIKYPERKEKILAAAKKAKEEKKAKEKGKEKDD